MSTGRYFEDGTRKERTGWRDQQISQWHREWGYNCPAVDIDFLLVEYNFGKPVALIEYKHNRIFTTCNLNHPTYKAISELANRSRLPFAIVYYTNEPRGFMAEPVNELSRRWFIKHELLSEYEFVMKLYAIRGNQMAAELAKRLNRQVPNPYEFRHITNR